MRYVQMFLLQLQVALQERMISIVWLLVGLTASGTLLLYWTAALSSGHNTSGITLASITSYYLISFVVGSFSISHIEEMVAVEDIQMGGLSRYLLKPVSYVFQKFWIELSFRVMHLVMSLIVVVPMSLLFFHIQLTHIPLFLVAGVFSCVLALLLSFLFKVLIGLFAFWMTTIRGIMEFCEIVMIVLTGFVVPLAYFPAMIRPAVLISPFAAMAYYPVVMFQGQVNSSSVLQMIGFQVGWIVVFFLLLSILWNKGLRTYTGVGQ